MDLQDLHNDAANVAKVTLNPTWRRAWEALADAADRLDAMFARSEERRGAASGER